MHAMKTWSVGCMIAMLAGAVLSAAAQAPWPSKPITYVVPFAPGGNTDTLARLIGPKLSSRSASLSSSTTSPAPAAISAQLSPPRRRRTVTRSWAAQSVRTRSTQASIPSMPYDAVKSFEPVIMLGTGPLVLVAGAATPYKSLQDVIAAAKAKPGDLASRPRVPARPRIWRASCSRF